MIKQAGNALCKVTYYPLISHACALETSLDMFGTALTSINQEVSLSCDYEKIISWTLCHNCVSCFYKALLCIEEMSMREIRYHAQHNFCGSIDLS